MPRILLLLGLLPSLSASIENQQTINSVAGGYTGDGLVADSPAIGLASPQALAFDAEGNLFIAAIDHRIRRVDATDNVITTFAGDGRSGLVGDGRPASTARLNQPADIAFDADDNLFIADRQNHVIRRIDGATGIISRLAGTGEEGFSGDGGEALAATFRSPVGLALDAAGNLFVADQFNARVRRIDASTGLIETVAGNGDFAYAGDGGPAVDASFEFSLVDVAIDAAGDLLVLTGQRIRRVDGGTGVITTILGGGALAPAAGVAATDADFRSLSAFFLEADGNILVADPTRVYRLDRATGLVAIVAGEDFAGNGGDGGPALEARFFLISALVREPDGDLLLADAGNSRLRRVDATTGLVASPIRGLIGNGTATDVSVLNRPTGVLTDVRGNVYFADQFNFRIARIGNGLGLIETIAGNGLQGPDGDGGPALDARLGSVQALALGPDSALYLVDQFAIRRIDLDAGLIEAHAPAPPNFATMIEIDATGAIFAPQPNDHVIRRWDPASGLWETIAGSGVAGYGGDGGPATAALLNEPSGLALDGQSVLVADSENHVIRRVDLVTGLIETYAGNGVRGTVDNADPLAASFQRPRRLARARDGTVLVLEQSYVRRIDWASGAVEIYAGTGVEGFAGDGGDALDAQLVTLFDADIAVDPFDNVYVTDPVNSRIRRIETIRPRVVQPDGTDAGAVVGTAVAVDDVSVMVGVRGESVAIFDDFKSVDPVPSEILPAPPGMAPDFGAVIARSAELLVVGAPGNAPFAKGSADDLQAAIYQRVASGWQLLQRIRGDGAGTGDDGFGSSIAVSGNMIAIGAPRDDEGEEVASGAVYIYSFAGGAVTFERKLKPVAPAGGERFGQSVAMAPGRLVVGSPGARKPETTLTTGVATLYDVVAGNLAPVGVIAPTTGTSADAFGAAIALDGTTLVVGAPGSSPGGVATGAAFVFDANSQIQTGQLVPDSPIGGASFGTAVSASGGQIVVGSPFEPVAANTVGAVYRFGEAGAAERIPALPGQQAFGSVVASFNDRIAIGAPETPPEGASLATGSANTRRVALRFFSSGFEER